ncbi:hypothetical protein ACFFX0_05550 [Citricoccus parietis]|uniref:Uncharacterized protein n=1 Tax=Citricoccus parietis TaxID=592307 RepID=A0ABV5FW52_9MICC
MEVLGVLALVHDHRAVTGLGGRCAGEDPWGFVDLESHAEPGDGLHLVPGAGVCHGGRVRQVQAADRRRWSGRGTVPVCAGAEEVLHLHRAQHQLQGREAVPEHQGRSGPGGLGIDQGVVAVVHHPVLEEFPERTLEFFAVHGPQPRP